MRAVVALGITQIIAWGTSFYVLGVLGHAIVADTGWSSELVFGGFTGAVLMSSAISSPAGWALDRFGARRVMAAGFVCLPLALAALAMAVSPATYMAAWIATGIGMRLTLYDAAFAALVQVDATNGRRAIAYLTLFGGFASTVGWLVGHALAQEYGWRGTLAIFAAVNLAACLPLVWFGVPAPEKSEPDRGSAANDGTSNNPAQAPAEGLTGRAKLIALGLFSLVMSANAIVFGVGAIHLVSLIENAGVGLTAAVGIASLKGIAQVGGRVLDLAFGHHLSPMMLGRVAIALVPISFGVLLATAGPVAATVFVLLFGLSNGLVTIVRGAVPLALFGARGYGTILGLLATPVLLFNALAPLGFTVLVERAGMAATAWVLFAIGLAASVSMEVLATWVRRRARPQ